MNVLGIVQARMGSTRLPGKALAKIGTRTVLEWVFHRLALNPVGHVVVATTTLPEDDAIEELCARNNVDCFRGAARNVLSRYYHCARYHHADVIARVTADCPLLDPWLLDCTVAKLIGEPFDYSATSGWPEGIGQEAFTQNALERTWLQAKSPFDREHVVTYMIDNPTFRSAVLLRNEEDPPPLRLTLDTPADLELLRRLYRNSHRRIFDTTTNDIIDMVTSDQRTLALATR